MLSDFFFKLLLVSFFTEIYFKGNTYIFKFLFLFFKQNFLFSNFLVHTCTDYFKFINIRTLMITNNSASLFIFTVKVWQNMSLILQHSVYSLF